MKPSFASSADLGKLDGRGSAGSSGSILYTYWGRGDGAGILRLVNVHLGRALILVTEVRFKNDHCGNYPVTQRSTSRWMQLW